MRRVRGPAAAGMFYPDSKDELEAEIRRCYAHVHGPRAAGAGAGAGAVEAAGPEKPVIGAICPHAGYMYSGPVACHSMAALGAELARRGGKGGPRPPLFIMAGPNHWGLGATTATMPDCAWRTPLGDVDVDSAASGALASESGGMAEPDFFAHAKEHSLEVQVPMLQDIAGAGLSILPVLMSDQTREAAERLGRAMARVAAKQDGGPALLIGSSDLTHYEPNAAAHEKDMELVEAVLDMDVGRFYDVLRDRRVSACGYGAMAATMTACSNMGASEGRLLKYATSFDVAGTGEPSVVGYASVVFR